MRARKSRACVYGGFLSGFAALCVFLIGAPHESRAASPVIIPVAADALTWSTLATSRPARDWHARAQEIVKRELVSYVTRTPASERAIARAERVLPMGVASSFQYYEPHPLVMRSAASARIIDVDGHEYVDFTLGYGALFAGHGHPIPRRAVADQLAWGMLFVNLCEKIQRSRSCWPRGSASAKQRDAVKLVLFVMACFVYSAPAQAEVIRFQRS
jgi:hypothetical protein